MLTHPLINFETKKYYWSAPKSKRIYLQNILANTTKDGACVVNLDEYKSIGTYGIAFYVNGNNVTYFDSFGVEHIPKEIKRFIGNKNIITNIFRIQAHNSIKCGYFCIGFVDWHILWLTVCWLAKIIQWQILQISYHHTISKHW